MPNILRINSGIKVEKGRYDKILPITTWNTSDKAKINLPSMDKLATDK
jgi:hypothetical protein